MLDFIKWLKHYNDHSDKPIVLYGFDIQVNVDIVDDLLKFYAKTDKEAENLTAALKNIIDNNGGVREFRKYPDLLQDSVMKIINRLADKHALNRKNYILNAGFVEYEYSAKRIEVLSNQMKMLSSGYGQSLIMRDSCNAELIKWIKDFEGEKSKIILFAHNGHLGKSLFLHPRVRTLSTQGFDVYTPKEFLTGYY
jgi:erythromycin esterase